MEFENAQMRVLRITYGPPRKSMMHSHPNAVAFVLVDQCGKLTFPDGKSMERASKAGETGWTSPETHLPENLSDKPLELILVELKAKPTAAKAQQPKARASRLAVK